jgi:maleate isomerase
MRKRLKRVGLLVPAANVAAEPELSSRLRDVASVHTARMYYQRGAEEAMLDRYLPEAVRDLAMLKPDMVIFACTTGGALRGNAYEHDLVQRIGEQTGAPAISVMAESVQALRRMGVHRIAVLTPYPPEDNAHIKASLTEAGLDVVAIDGLQIEGVASPELTTEELIDFGKKIFDGVDYEAVFIPCTNLFTLDAIDQFEAAFGKPVVTTLGAALAAVNRELGLAAATA